MLVLDYDLICAHILLPFVRDARPPATAVVSLDNAVLCKVLLKVHKPRSQSVKLVDDALQSETAHFDCCSALGMLPCDACSAQ